MTKEIILQARNLTKQYHQRNIVNGINLNVAKGDILGLLGVNGAGKTTSMRMMAGYLMPDDGDVLINDINLYDGDVYGQQKGKANIGYLPEGVPLYDDFSVIGFLKFIAKMRILDKNNIKNRLDDVINALSLEQVLNMPIEQLSKGFKRRVGIAQAIIHDPKLLILDEPTDGLDPLQKSDIRDLIKKLSQDKAIIISTHILEEVETICNHAAIIDQGNVIFNDTADRLCHYDTTAENTHLENKMEHIFRYIIEENRDYQDKAS